MLSIENLGSWGTQTWSQKVFLTGCISDFIEAGKSCNIFCLAERSYNAAGVDHKEKLRISISNIQKDQDICGNVEMLVSGKIYKQALRQNFPIHPPPFIIAWNLKWMIVRVLEGAIIRKYWKEFLFNRILWMIGWNDLVERAEPPQSFTTTTSRQRQTCKWFCW